METLSYKYFIILSSINSVYLEYLENDCEMEDIYKQRIDQFFKFKDKHNSQRVYDWIKNH